MGDSAIILRGLHCIGRRRRRDFGLLVFYMFGDNGKHVKKLSSI
jgi:hypothetical protein